MVDSEALMGVLVVILVQVYGDVYPEVLERCSFIGS